MKKCFFFLLLIIFNAANAQELYKSRLYEPIIIRGDVLAAFYDVPINEIYMYAFNSETRAWKMIPFQIDEMAYGSDPFYEENQQDFYFLPDNGVLDFRDELVFMARDLGDKANQYTWINNDEAKSYDRLELRIHDPNDHMNVAYAYLYRSSTIEEEVPHPYEFSFDPVTHTVNTKFYTAKFSLISGLFEDIAIKPPFGSGVDIFDTQKIRFEGFFDLFGGLIPIPFGRYKSDSANERDHFRIFSDPNDKKNFHLYYTPKPVVRLIREVRHTIVLGGLPIPELAFYVTTKFYPFSATAHGGAALDPDTLQKELGAEVIVEVDLLRHSWDFNEAATGMKFYNRYNDGVIIDGVQDTPQKKIDIPISEWTMASGDQGTVFMHVKFEDTSWENIGLYFYDNKNGGQGDSTQVSGGDTGDGKSFGDQGILFKNLNQRSVNLEMGFTAYFLPKNLNKLDAEQLAYTIENRPAVAFQTISVKQKDFNTTIENFKLSQNYPNPFNSSTKIQFSIPAFEIVQLNIIDINGRLVRSLINKKMNSGTHDIIWDGLDKTHQSAASGIYIYELRVGDFTASKKLLLLH